MADIIAFPSRPAIRPEERYRAKRTIGGRSGITVRILSRVGKPHDLIVVLDGTCEGSTTVAALPAGQGAVADVIAHSTLATLEAAERAWRPQSSASNG